MKRQLVSKLLGAHFTTHLYYTLSLSQTILLQSFSSFRLWVLAYDNRIISAVNVGLPFAVATARMNPTFITWVWFIIVIAIAGTATKSIRNVLFSKNQFKKIHEGQICILIIIVKVISSTVCCIGFHQKSLMCFTLLTLILKYGCCYGKPLSGKSIQHARNWSIS